MKVWKLAADCEKDVMLMIEPHLDVGGYYLKNFIGTPMASDWRSPEIKIVYKNKRIRDFVSLSPAVPVLSAKAKEVLEPIIGSVCEFLPLLELRNKQYYALNVLSIIDCLDVKNSDVTWVPNVPGKISQIWKHAFFADKIPNDTVIFKIPDRVISSVFVTQRFVDAVIANDLKGAAFLDPAEDNLVRAAFGKPLNVVEGLPK